MTTSQPLVTLTFELFI